MKFHIYRTSDNATTYSEEMMNDRRITSPCTNARLEHVGNDRYCYVVDINTLDELIDLLREIHGEVVIDVRPKYVSVEMPFIEIYDDYRE